MKARGRRRRSGEDLREVPWLWTPPAEQLAAEASREITAGPVLCSTLGRGQCAVDLARRLPDAAVDLWLLDDFAATETRELFGSQCPRLELFCQPDFPEKEYECAVIPVTIGGESELTREMLQQAYHRLTIGGVLIAAIDHRRDTWLHHELEKLGKSLTRLPVGRGVIYQLRKKDPLKRLRDYRCEFAFRDQERLVKVVSRPSVFSHRRLDLGARALLEAVEVQPAERILDIGCGSGAVGLALTLRSAGARLHGLDANPRATLCLLEGAKLNGLTAAPQVGDWSDEWDVTASVNAAGELPQEGRFDLAIGNPPYFSNFKIADIFLHAALRGLRPGGRVAMVTQQSEWFIARMQQLFRSVSDSTHRGYTVVQAIRK